MPTSHPVDRARLTQHAPSAPSVYRYEPRRDLRDLVRCYWLPVWDVAGGGTVTEQVLPYPTALVVVGNDYARLYGATRGMSTRTLRGRGWAAGVMLQPGAAQVVAGRDLGGLVDTHIDLAQVPLLAALEGPLRQVMGPDPADPIRHASAIARIEQTLAQALPLDADGTLLNQVVDVIESCPDLHAVRDLADRVGIGERALQRLTSRRLGLTPKELIQRRRLQEAADHLKRGVRRPAELAFDLGYTDQAHFTRDFRRVTGHTPAAFTRTFGAPTA